LERSRLDEIYTVHLIRATINNGRNVPSTLTDGRLKGWVRVRTSHRHREWKRLWMCVSAGKTTRAIAPSLGRDKLNSPDVTVTPKKVTPKKRGISGLFSRDKSNDPPKQANILLYGRKGKNGRDQVHELTAVTGAFAVYPERSEFISSRPLIKLENTFHGEGPPYSGKGGARRLDVTDA
jgi:CCR4-NOT transcriptional complex subunit CAF120